MSIEWSLIVTFATFKLATFSCHLTNVFLSLAQVWNECGFIGRPEVACTAQWATEASAIRSRCVSVQHVVTRRSHDPWDEHSSALHEGAEQSNAGPPREQQLLLHQHQYWTGRLRMVCNAWHVLGWNPSAVREEQHQLSARQLVAGTRRSLRRQHSCVSIHATTWRSRLG